MALGLSHSDWILLQTLSLDKGLELEGSDESDDGTVEEDKSQASGPPTIPSSGIISREGISCDDNAKSWTSLGQGVDLCDEGVSRKAEHTGVELSDDDLMHSAAQRRCSGVELSDAESDENGAVDGDPWRPGWNMGLYYNRNFPLDQQGQVLLVNVYSAMKRLPRNALKIMLEHLDYVGTYCSSLALRAASAVLRMPGTSIFKLFNAVRNGGWIPVARTEAQKSAGPKSEEGRGDNKVRVMESLVRLALSVRTSGMSYIALIFNASLIPTFANSQIPKLAH